MTARDTAFKSDDGPTHGNAYKLPSLRIMVLFYLGKFSVFGLTPAICSP